MRRISSTGETPFMDVLHALLTNLTDPSTVDFCRIDKQTVLPISLCCVDRYAALIFPALLDASTTLHFIVSLLNF